MRITRFSSMLPAASGKHLPIGAATYAKNTRTTNGTLRALRTPIPIGQCDGELGLAVDGNYVCRPPCSVAPLNCGANIITAKDGNLVYENGAKLIPDPLPAPTVSSTGKNGVLTAFRVAALGEFGNEGPISPPSNISQIEIGARVTLDTTSRARVYALIGDSLDGKLPAQGESAAQWVVVGDFEPPVQFIFDPSSWVLATDVDMDEMCTPENVHCVARDEVGHLYAWNDTTVWISDRGAEYAFPMRGRVTIEHNIKKVVPYYDSAIIVTDGKPFLLRPNMDNNGLMNPIAIPYAAHHGLFGPTDAIAPADMGVVYPSRDGLILLTPQAPLGFRLLTRDVVHAEEWREQWAPKTLAYHNGVLISDKWIMEMQDQQHGSNPLGIFALHDFGVDKLQSLPDGRLIGYKNGQITQWFAGEYAEAEFESEIVIEQGLRVLTAAKVVGKNLDGVVFQLFDAETRHVLHTKRLSQQDNNKPFRLPALRRQHFFVKIAIPSSNKEITIEEIHIGPDINDLVRPEGVKE